MRYTQYTRQLKAILDSGRIGEIVSIQHLEPVGYWHQAHSFVRGNWRNEAASSPMLLAKSCHDLDWIRFLMGKPCAQVSSFGSLKHFRAEERPEGAGDRCLDCSVEPACPYSAARFYLGLVARGKTGWPVDVLTPDTTVAGVTEALRSGPYGRCVYACDNDVADHQVVTVDFEGGVTATLTMSAFTPDSRRHTRIMGTRGFLDSDGERLTVTDFVTGHVESVDLVSNGADGGEGHDGGDFGVMGAFVDAVAAGDPSLIRSGPRESLESHLMAFAAERSRVTGVPVPVWE